LPRTEKAPKKERGGLRGEKLYLRENGVDRKNAGSQTCGKDSQGKGRYLKPHSYHQRAVGKTTTQKDFKQKDSEGKETVLVKSPANPKCGKYALGKRDKE